MKNSLSIQIYLLYYNGLIHRQFPMFWIKRSICKYIYTRILLKQKSEEKMSVSYKKNLSLREKRGGEQKRKDSKNMTVFDPPKIGSN